MHHYWRPAASNAFHKLENALIIRCKESSGQSLIEFNRLVVDGQVNEFVAGVASVTTRTDQSNRKVALCMQKFGTITGPGLPHRRDRSTKDVLMDLINQFQQRGVCYTRHRLFRKAVSQAQIVAWPLVQFRH